MKKEGWPQFPFSHWEVGKWNMQSLRYIATHLHDKSESFSRVALSGFTGEPNPMERQIIDHVGSLGQQIAVLTDVVQALLQIIDDQRPSRKAARLLRWTREGAKNFWHKVEESTLYKILAVVGALITLWFIIRHATQFFHHLRK
jgi:hypothetical protein